MQSYLQLYNHSFFEEEKMICDLLAQTIDQNLNYSDSKIWHRHPVWFIDGNPILGYRKEKKRNPFDVMEWHRFRRR